MRSAWYQPFHFVDDSDSSILCNTSGAGKTRLLFEGLCKHWGFYFVSARDTNGIGAQDLEFMIARMWTTQGWVTNIFKDRAQKDIAVADAENEKIVFNQIYKVLLARWMVFRTFIEVAKKQNGDLLPNNIKHDWLIFQLLPVIEVDGKDPFLAFINSCLVGASLETLVKFLDTTGPAVVLGSAFERRDSFFYILDEAQVAGERYIGAFADASATARRPVLRPIVRAWSSISTGRSIKFIVSGTGFSLDIFQTVLASGIGKVPEKWDVFHCTGDFMNPGTQSSYISRYLPPSFLLSESGTVLVSRMYEWLRGRRVMFSVVGQRLKLIYVGKSSIYRQVSRGTDRRRVDDCMPKFPS